MMTTATKLELLQKHSLSSVLEQEIEALIIQGALVAGERINELQLAERFGVSRSPIRDALRALEAAGLVEQVPNRGLFIRRVDTTRAVEVYGVRAALFGYAGAEVASAASPAQIASLVSLHQEMGEAAARHEFATYFPLNFAFHDRLVAASGNGVLATQYRSLVRQLRLLRGRNLRSGDTLSISHGEHQRIVDALVARDRERAFNACFDHVEMGKARLIARHKDINEHVAPSGGEHEAKVA